MRNRTEAEMAKVKALRDEAATAGDTDCMVLCDRALAGDSDAMGECLEIIAYAATQWTGAEEVGS